MTGTSTAGMTRESTLPSLRTIRKFSDYPSNKSMDSSVGGWRFEGRRLYAKRLDRTRLGLAARRRRGEPNISVACSMRATTLG